VEIDEKSIALLACFDTI